MVQSGYIVPASERSSVYFVSPGAGRDPHLKRSACVSSAFVKFFQHCAHFSVVQQAVPIHSIQTFYVYVLFLRFYKQ